MRLYNTPPNKFSTHYFYHFIGTFRILFAANKASQIHYKLQIHCKAYGVSDQPYREHRGIYKEYIILV